MTELKIKPEYYQPLIENRKPFEIRGTTDRTFKAGDMVRLNEYLGYDYIGACKHESERDCEGWEEIDDIPEYGENEAIAICGEARRHCGSYLRHKFSGRYCDIVIKEIFDLSAVVLEKYVAFTFDIVKVGQDCAYTLSKVTA